MHSYVLQNSPCVCGFVIFIMSHFFISSFLTKTHFLLKPILLCFSSSHFTWWFWNNFDIISNQGTEGSGTMLDYKLFNPLQARNMHWVPKGCNTTLRSLCYNCFLLCSFLWLLSFLSAVKYVTKAFFQSTLIKHKMLKDSPSAKSISVRGLSCAVMLTCYCQAFTLSAENFQWHFPTVHSKLVMMHGHTFLHQVLKKTAWKVGVGKPIEVYL